jgi:large subunit ribosomal protein L9
MSENKMQLILLENIKKLGTIGQKVNVKDGYARNFLLKNKKALLANKKNIELFEKKREEINKKNEIEKNKAIETSKSINNIEFIIFKESMENGQLYGSINIKEIISLIKNEKNIEIFPEQVEIKGQIKSTGLVSVFINLHAEVQATIKLDIKPKVE